MLELTPQQQEFVDAQVATGMFRGPGEVVSAALSLLSERQREYANLQPAIEQVEQGEYAPLNVEDIKHRGRQRASGL